MINYNKIENYDEKYLSVECFEENLAVKEILDRYVLPDNSILDIGCGTGFALDLIGDRINRESYFGIDIAHNQIIQACRKHPDAHFIVSDVNDVKLTKTYDIVLSIFSLPYTGETTADFVYNALSDNGIFIAVYYDKPYRNPASVYSNRMIEYFLDVKPKLNRVLKGFLDERFELLYKAPLTHTRTYEVVVYRKVGIEK